MDSLTDNVAQVKEGPEGFDDNCEDQCGVPWQYSASNMTESNLQELQDTDSKWSGGNRSLNATWLKKFEELKRFKSREGHCDVSPRSNANKGLGKWVNNQRTQYRLLREGKPTKITEKMIQLLQNVGFEWVTEPSDEAWLKRCEELKHFKIQEGHCNVPQRYSKNKSLGRWVDRQRTQYKLMREGKPSSMNESRIQYLENIGFQWVGEYCQSNDTTWLLRFEELKCFKDHEGHCYVPQRYRGNRSLGKWVDTQRTQYKYMMEGKPSSMNETRIQHLENIGFQWVGYRTNDDSWMEMYQELKLFKAHEGHCNVPQYSANKRLGSWVNTQRIQYRYMKEGKPSCMTDLRVQYLELLGFEWIGYRPNDDSWVEKYEELKRFKYREGHCNVPQRYGANESLGTWVSMQRTQYWFMREGKPSNMTESKIQYLQDIGFEWVTKSNDDTWMDRYEELKRFKLREGHCYVPQRYPANRRLGKWVDKQRTQYKLMREGKQSSLTPTRIQYLENIGFQWSGHRPNDDAWMHMYEELKRFECLEGHVNVPQQYSANKRLGAWVSTQRTQYRYLKEGKPSSMTSSRIQYLENVDFRWMTKDL